MHDERTSWEKLEMYPYGITSLFRKIKDLLIPILWQCTLLVVGSYSQGTPKYLIKNRRVKYFSDIDLLVVIPNNRRDILLFRDDVSEHLNRLTSTLNVGYDRFHIGIRYRFVSELPEFATKCESLGYRFYDDALTIHSGYPVEPTPSTIHFGPGHAAENLCSKIWTIIRYLDLSATNNRDHPYYVHVIKQATSCMESTIAYCNNIVNMQIPNITYEDKNLANHTTVEDNLSHIVLIYSPFINQLVHRNNTHCIAASKDEEFDFFRVSNGQPDVLTLNLTRILELMIRVYQENECNDILAQIYESAQQMNLFNKVDVNMTPRAAFTTVRYGIAKKRMLLSPLFRRDRGPSFLSSLQKT